MKTIHTNQKSYSLVFIFGFILFLAWGSTGLTLAAPCVPHGVDFCWSCTELKGSLQEISLLQTNNLMLDQLNHTLTRFNDELLLEVNQLKFKLGEVILELSDVNNEVENLENQFLDAQKEIDQLNQKLKEFQSK